MANSQSTEAIPTEVAASPYHRFEPAHQATESFDSFSITLTRELRQVLI